MYTRLTTPAAAALALCAACGSAAAADWSDTSISVRYGTTFAEPYANENADGSSRKDIKKTIVALTHASGYKYGSNFFNIDLLQSDRNDPADGEAGKSGAQEAYIVYRHTLDLGKVTGKELKFGPVRGFGLTAGFDWNTKNDGYGSRKRMLVAGPTMMFDVPGFLDVSVLGFWESNAPNFINDRYRYKTHPALGASWGIPIADLPLVFKGYALWIAGKGDNETGGPTVAETHLDMSLMYDVGAATGMGKNTLLVGLEYEYWRNKFGNPTRPYAEGGAGDGATASTPMVRVEYHF